ncbi:MAG: hypothetical protein FJ090_00195 [Deltaproteobacteria bacterium]|nr:hypothetical protein [Deltaproteobacteria bacterium]
MNLELLGRLARSARFLPRVEGAGASAALAALPALVDGLPELRPTGDGRAMPQIPVACGAVLNGAIERALRDVLDGALADLPPVPADEEARKLATDPVVALLRHLLLEAHPVSPGACVVMALEYARVCASQLVDPGALVAEQVRQFRALPAAKRHVAHARVAHAMRARLSVAIVEEARAGRAPSALLAALAANPLPYLFGRGAFDAELDLGLLHAVVGGSVPSEQVAAAVAALRHAVGLALARLATRKATADDQALALRACVPQLVEQGPAAAADVLAADPDTWAFVLPNLARFSDQEQLVAAGLTADQARALLRVDVAMAVAASMRATLLALRAWDVLTTLTTALAPVRDDDPVERRLVVPRGRPVEATVVAVLLSGARAMGDGTSLPDAASTAWESWTASAEGALRVDLGVVGLVIFGDPVVAARFAASLRDRGTGTIPVPPISVATGRVTGGTDGGTVRVGGPAVSEAMRLLPSGPLSARPEGMHSLARLAVYAGQLSGAGVVVDVVTTEALRRSGLQPHPSKRRPRGVAVREVWDSEEGLLVLVDIPALEGGFELVRVSPADWSALLDAPIPVEPTLDPSVPPASELSRAQSRHRWGPCAPEDAAAPLAYEGESDDDLPSNQDQCTATSLDGGYDGTWGARPTPGTAATPSGSAPAPPAPPSSPPLAPAGTDTTAPPASPAPPPQRARPREIIVPELSEDPFGFAVDAPPAMADPFGGGVASDTAAGEGGFSDIFGVPAAPVDAPQPKPGPPPTMAPPMLSGDDFSLTVEEDEGDELSSPFLRADGREVAEEHVAFALPEGVSGGENRAIEELAPTKGPKLAAVDFGFVLNGYACYVLHERVVFGRPYGTRLIDHHAYDTGSNLDRAYQIFLQDKIREGFIPQTEMVGDLPRGVTVMPLEPERLAAAWRALT